jgi:hypothetical protein
MSQGEDELSVENSVQDDCRLLKNRGFSLSVHFYIILPATLYENIVTTASVAQVAVPPRTRYAPGYAHPRHTEALCSTRMR